MNMHLPTIELAKEIQIDLGLQDTHVVWLGETGFTIAHTDAERRWSAIMREELNSCPLHRWLSSVGYIQPHLNRIGWYTFWYDERTGIWRKVWTIKLRSKPSHQMNKMIMLNRLRPCKFF